ncbi:hypothetical protein LB559_09425 [Mesorhizobium sp. BR1-1-3]|uniref:hypothetical protein n=1 Tax=Mesorhizobium sp. BR1-1-3 TaxID=2876651 RepID=UPI001CD06DCB|nr:hypothetical protein [Mesorhizobium sp. BR1-1-3]MBZ9888159.1 hypothetical protein [Mesorhizobium sp. BR1-1-3]
MEADAMWANYMGAAEAARREVIREAARIVLEAEPYAGPYVHDIVRALIAQPDGSDEIPAFIERP